MNKLLLLIAAVLVLAGGAYLATAHKIPDTRAVAVAEALALHTRAIKAALDEECSDARETLDTWRRLRKAGTPDPDDSRQARKVLRKMLKKGCRDHT